MASARTRTLAETIREAPALFEASKKAPFHWGEMVIDLRKMVKNGDLPMKNGDLARTNCDLARKHVI